MLATAIEDAMVPDRQKTDVLNFTATIVAAYVSNNTVEPEDIGAVIRQVHGTLVALVGGHDTGLRDEPKPAGAATKKARFFHG